MTIREFYAAFVIYQGALIAGMDTAFSAYILSGRDNITTSQESLIGSLSIYMKPVGSLCTIFFIDSIGRKRTLQGSLILNIIAWSVLAYTKSEKCLYLGRMFSGIASGSRSTAGNVYLSEVANKNTRGRLLAARPAFDTIGTSLPLIIAAYYDWRLLAKLALFMALAGFVQMVALPETKYFYIIKGDREKARRSVLWFRPDTKPSDIDNELQNIEFIVKSNSSPKSSSIFQILQEPAVRKGFILLFIINVLSTGFGRLAIFAHIEHFFKALNTEFDNKKLVVILGVLDVFASLGFVMIVEKVRRKSLLYFTLAAMGVSLAGIMAYNLIQVLFPFKSALCNSIPVLLFYLFLLLRVNGFNASIEMLKSEIIIHQRRGVILTAATIVFQILSATYSYILPYALDYLDVNYVLLYFLVHIFLMYIVVKIFVIETSGKELYECAEPVLGKKALKPMGDEHLVNNSAKNQYLVNAGC